MGKDHRNANMGPKSIPSARVIIPVWALNDTGSVGAVTDQNPLIFDLEDYEYHEGVVRLESKTINGQGGTPTSPGAAVTLTLKWAFLNESIVAADVPVVCQNIMSSLVITLPNSAASSAAGTRIQATADLVVLGRYLGIWYDRQAFAANALIDWNVNLIRV